MAAPHLTGRVLFVLALAVAPRLAAPAFGADLRLVEAARHQDRASIEALLARRIDVNSTQPDGATALLWAAQWDNLDIARLLIRAGAKVDTANRYGVTPLSMACTNGSAAMIRALLEAGANPGLALPSGETPLMTAARTGRLDAVNALLEQRVNIDAKEAVRGQTALMWAISEEHRDVVRALLAHGAHVRDASASGFTPILFAARHGNLELFKLLLAHGADVNETAADGVSVLHVAAVRGHVALAEFLLDHGADPNAAGPGYTPLHWAVGTWETFMTLQYFHLDSGEWSVLGGALTRTEKLRLINALVAKGADVNARMKKSPPRFGDRIGADVMGGGSYAGGTPFFLAANAADLEVMRLLVEHGADPLLATTDQTTPLMMAAGLGTAEAETRIPERQHLDAVKYCLGRGASINAANARGNTAMHATAFLGYDAIARYLFERGADVNARNKRGETPLKIAEGFENQMMVFTHESTAALLRSWGGVTP